MATSWKVFEDYVRAIATLKFGHPCQSEHVSGVDLDGVIHISGDELVLVEITENLTLQKVREDITKVSAVRTAQLLSGVSCKAFLVLDGEPTPSMTELGTQSHVTVLSAKQFENMFFNYESYVRLRQEQPFGSAVDSETGKNDPRKYVGVSFNEKHSTKTYDVASVCKELIKGHKLVVTGDYGTGKSRLVREVFERLKVITREAGAYALAINLREHWGSATFLEIISGHLQGIGLSTSIDNAVRLLQSGRLILLLDGFDEIGAQSHDTRVEDRISLRKQALRGVRNLMQQTRAGVLITGRSHYFDEDLEIIEALGLDPASTLVKLIDVPPNFTQEQAKLYLNDIGLNITPPEWLPRKPLVFQIAAELQKEDLEKVLKAVSGPFEFWGLFLGSVTRRESKGVQDTIPPSTIRAILIELGGISRSSTTPLGRFSPTDINEAYRLVNGSLPDAVGQQLLARMCTLGRIEPQSPDRQFLDNNIAEIVRAEHLVTRISTLNEAATKIQWKQPLTPVGVFHAASAIDSYDMEQRCFSLLSKYATSANRVLLGEVISILSIISEDTLDFKALTLRHGHVPILFVDKNKIKNLEIVSTEIAMLVLDVKTASLTDHFTIRDSLIVLISGITNSSALPHWITGTGVLGYEEDVKNSAGIKASNLPDGQKLLLSIIHKIFFQPGSGREEGALLKGGYGKKYDQKMVDDILRKMLSEGLLEKFKGDDGFVYKPIRRHTERMSRIKSELSLSEDLLWTWAAGLK